MITSLYSGGAGLASAITGEASVNKYIHITSRIYYFANSLVELLGFKLVSIGYGHYPQCHVVSINIAAWLGQFREDIESTRLQY